MPMTAKEKLMHRRQRRVAKLRLLRVKLQEASDSKTRERILGKIQRISPLYKVETK